MPIAGRSPETEPERVYPSHAYSGWTGAPVMIPGRMPWPPRRWWIPVKQSGLPWGQSRKWSVHLPAIFWRPSPPCPAPDRFHKKAAALFSNLHCGSLFQVLFDRDLISLFPRRCSAGFRSVRRWESLLPRGQRWLPVPNRRLLRQRSRRHCSAGRRCRSVRCC